MLIGAVSERLENMDIEITPVDYCTKAIADIIRYGRINAVYHLYNNKFKVKDLIKVMRRLGIADIVTMDELQFKNHIAALSNDLNRQNSLAGLINELNNLDGFDYDDLIQTSNLKTLSILNSIGFKWPDPIDPDYIGRLFDYMKEVDFIRKSDESLSVV